jgi:hypothetical protein
MNLKGSSPVHNIQIHVNETTIRIYLRHLSFGFSQPETNVLFFNMSFQLDPRLDENQ